MQLTQDHSLQKEVLEFLIIKILEFRKIEQKNQILKEIESKFFKNDFSLDYVLRNSANISKLLGISKDSFENFFSKNYLKTLQLIKKQKESYENSLKDEKTSVIQLITQNFFLRDLSTSYYIDKDNKLILIQDGNEIPENDLNVSYPREESPIKIIPQKKEKIIQTEEISIIQEILKKFQSLIKVPEKIVIIDENPASEEFVSSDEDTEINDNQETEHINKEISIIQEILEKFRENLEKSRNMIDKMLETILEEPIKSYDEGSIEILDSNESYDKENFPKISWSLSDYYELRKKIQFFQENKKIQEYNSFLQNSNDTVKVNIAILNIISKEKNIPQFDELIYLRSLSEKFSFSLESLKDLYQRIKKFDFCLSYLKKIALSLKEQNLTFYNYFETLEHQIVDFLSLIENEEEFENYIKENIDILVISIKNESHRIKLKNYLERVFHNLKPYLF